VQLAAEQAIAGIGTFEVERGCQAVACALVKPSVRRSPGLAAGAAAIFSCREASPAFRLAPVLEAT